MIWLSLHPSPAGETSAFNKMRAFKSRRAGLFPFRIKTSSRSRSSALSRTTYIFTDFSRVAIVPSVARIVTEANHQILSNWLKRATRHFSTNVEPLTNSLLYTCLSRQFLKSTEDLLVLRCEGRRHGTIVVQNPFHQGRNFCTDRLEAAIFKHSV